jgi:methylase of polypeptide subunit release factors
MKSVNGTFFIETSAKQSIKVEELFYKAAETMFKFYEISKDYRDLVKPERMTMSMAHHLPNSRITLSNSVFQE